MIISLYVEHFVLHFMNVLCYINKVIIIIIIIVETCFIFFFVYLLLLFDKASVFTIRLLTKNQ